MGTPLVYFLSTGRCGTQYATELLTRAAPENAVVLHEPLRERYASRKILRAPNLANRLREYPAARDQFAEVERIHAEGRIYIETGWPVFGWLPLLKERYGNDLVIVHLVREPIRFAHSMASHYLYRPEYRKDRYTELAAIMPTDPGCRFDAYAEHWPGFNDVEKCLYLWLEINAWGEELKQRFPTGWVNVRSKDLFTKPLAFLDRLRASHPGLRFLRNPTDLPGEVDQWHFPLTFDVDGVRGPSEVASLAAHYGFEGPTSADVLAQRFDAAVGH